MKATLIIAAVVLGLAGATTAVEAQYASTQPVVTADAGSARAGYDPAAARASLDRAHELAMSGRFVEARNAYRAVADMQKSAGVLPGEALWQVAALEYGQGGRHRLRAAQVMDELAEQAAIYGDPALQARALIEATILYHQNRRNAEARTCLDKLEPLLQSPHLTQELREQIESRLRRS
jgi:hypothetical protein